MALEAGELGTCGDRMVLERLELCGDGEMVLQWLKLPTLTSLLVLVVLEWPEVNGSSPLQRTVVFLLPQRLSWGLLRVWDPSVSLMGSWKVTFLAVFLLPPGVFTANWSREWVAAKLGTLKLIIPNLSDVAYERRLGGLVASSKT